MAATLEQIDKLRERANVGYEEAKEAMTLCNDDFLSALIYLEKSGKVKANANPEPQKNNSWTQSPSWASQNQWTNRYQQNGYTQKGYTYTCPPPGYNHHAWHIQQKLQRKAEKAHTWANKVERKIEAEYESLFWKDLWCGIKRFFRLSVYAVCIVPIMFFATLAALFTKFTVKIERKDGKNVPFNETLQKISQFADDAVCCGPQKKTCDTDCQEPQTNVAESPETCEVCETSIPAETVAEIAADEAVIPETDDIIEINK